MNTTSSKINESVASKMDEQGNSVVAYKNDNMIKLYLKLKTESRRRKLGFINMDTKTLSTLT